MGNEVIHRQQHQQRMTHHYTRHIPVDGLSLTKSDHLSGSKFKYHGKSFNIINISRTRDGLMAVTERKTSWRKESCNGWIVALAILPSSDKRWTQMNATRMSFKDRFLSQRLKCHSHIDMFSWSPNSRIKMMTISTRWSRQQRQINHFSKPFSVQPLWWLQWL